MSNILWIFFILIIVTIARPFSVIDISEQEQKDSLVFWTPEKIASAVPLEQLLFSNKNLTMNHEIREDTDYVDTELYKEHPYRTIGKLFFQVPGGTAFCSASSTGKNAILTAGHCVFRNGRGYSNYMFMPQYLNSRTPFGRFPGRAVIVHDDWRKNENMGRDLAFIVLSELRNQTLEAQVGRLELDTCEPVTKMRVFGYPRPTYGGEKMVRTIGEVWRRYPLPWGWNPAPIGWRSKMSNGSSGGPVIMKFQERNNGTGVNVACSVVSFGIQYTYYVFGPLVDKDVIEMRQKAINM